MRPRFDTEQVHHINTERCGAVEELVRGSIPNLRRPTISLRFTLGSVGASPITELTALSVDRRFKEYRVV